MTFIIFAVPIIVIIFLVIFITVFASDSKKYHKNLDNSKQMELERAREAALRAVEEMRRIKESMDTGYETNKKVPMQQEVTSSVYSKLSEMKPSRELIQQKAQARKNIVSVENRTNKNTINEYQKYYNDNYNKGRSKFNQQRNFRQQTFEQNNIPRLEFSRENLVRGLIAKEYLNRKQGGNIFCINCFNFFCSR